MGFIKKHKVWSSIVGIVIIFLAGVSLLTAVKYMVVTTTDCPSERHYVEFMTGVIDPQTPFFLGKGDLTKMKEDNMNTLQVYFSQHLPGFLYQLEKREEGWDIEDKLAEQALKKKFGELTKQ